MSLQAVGELAVFANNAVTQAYHLIALAGQGLNWMKHTLPSQHLKTGLPRFDLTQQFFIGGSLDGNPKPNSTVATIGEVLFEENHQEAIQWLAISCLVGICFFWSPNTRKELANELGIAEQKYFKEPVLAAAVLRRNDYIHNLGYARNRLHDVGPFIAIEEGALIRVSQEELRGFRTHIVASLPKLEPSQWRQYEFGKKPNS